MVDNSCEAKGPQRIERNIFFSPVFKIRSLPAIGCFFSSEIVFLLLFPVNCYLVFFFMLFVMQRDFGWWSVFKLVGLSNNLHKESSWKMRWLMELRTWYIMLSGTNQTKISKMLFPLCQLKHSYTPFHLYWNKAHSWSWVILSRKYSFLHKRAFQRTWLNYVLHWICLMTNIEITKSLGWQIQCL